MNRLNGGILFVCVALVLFASTDAGATTSRVLALGGDGAYFEDASGALRWYGSLGDYPDLAVLELADVLDGGDAPGNLHRLPGHGGGAHVRLDEAGRWGTAAFYVEDDLPADAPGGVFTALWSREFAGVQVGFYGRFTTFGEAAVTSAASDHGYSEYFHHFGLGLRADITDGLYGDLAAEIVNSQTESMDATHHLPPSDEWSSFGVRARAFYRLSETASLVPVIDHFSDERATWADIIEGAADRDARVTSWGLGLNVLPDADTMVIVSTEYRTGREVHYLRDDEAFDALWNVSARGFQQIRGRIGVESRVLSWLSLRAAVQYVRGKDDIDRAGGGEHERLDFEDVAAPVSLGFGLHVGEFDVDFVHNDSAPVNPGLMGERLGVDGRDGFSSVSVVFRF